MKEIVLQMATELSDLDGLPVGSRILTNHSKIFELDRIETVTNRPDAGTGYWIEPGTLQPFPITGLEHWLPAYILPPKAGK